MTRRLYSVCGVGALKRAADVLLLLLLPLLLLLTTATPSLFFGFFSPSPSPPRRRHFNPADAAPVQPTLRPSPARQTHPLDWSENAFHPLPNRPIPIADAGAERVYLYAALRPPSGTLVSGRRRYCTSTAIIGFHLNDARPPFSRLQSYAATTGQSETIIVHIAVIIIMIIRCVPTTVWFSLGEPQQHTRSSCARFPSCILSDRTPSLLHQHPHNRASTIILCFIWCTILRIRYVFENFIFI